MLCSSGLIFIGDDFSVVAFAGQRAGRCSHARWTIECRSESVQRVHALSAEYDSLGHACFRPLRPDLLSIHFYLCENRADLFSKFDALVFEEKTWEAILDPVHPCTRSTSNRLSHADFIAAKVALGRPTIGESGREILDDPSFVWW
jgi:hypothetical protein